MGTAETGAKTEIIRQYTIEAGAHFQILPICEWWLFGFYLFFIQLPWSDVEPIRLTVCYAGIYIIALFYGSNDFGIM